MSSSARASLRIEGLTADELLALPSREFDALVFVDRPLVFKTGTAEVLGQFRCERSRLTVVLTHIDGGGEGVLPTIWRMADQYARRSGLLEVEWIVHAVHCARPNPKLRRVLERRGFSLRTIDGSEVYHTLYGIAETTRTIVTDGHPQ